MTMDQNNVMESSTLALTGLNVVIEEENDYVFVVGDLDDCDLDEWDDESYDHCDLSPTLSCATSVATNITLKDLNLIEDSAMMDVEETTNTEDNFKRMSDDEAREVLPFMANPKNGRRISNKKLRKKIKMMKKTAAAKAAAEAFANAGMPSSSSTTFAAPPGSPQRTSRFRKPCSMHSNIAVACAQESLAAYRDEIEAGKAQRKPSPVNFVM